MRHTLRQSARAVGVCLASIPLSILALIIVAVVMVLREPDDNPYLDELDDAD